MNEIKANEILSKYSDIFKQLNTHIYNHTEQEEILLLKWWMHLNESGDMLRLIKPSSRSVESFYSIFKYPTTLLYSLDQSGEIDNAGWIEPTEEKATIKTAQGGFWSRSDSRHKRRCFSFSNLYYNLTFEFFDAIVGITWQQDLLALHTKVGYNIVGCIPNYYDQPQCYIVHLTKEDFKQSKFSKIGDKLWQ